MKKSIAIVLVCLSVLMLLCACKRNENVGDVVESMVSTILPTDNTDKMGSDNGDNGTINDQDGIIGNENTQEETKDTTITTTEYSSMTEDNVL